MKPSRPKGESTVKMKPRPYVIIMFLLIVLWTFSFIILLYGITKIDVTEFYLYAGIISYSVIMFAIPTFGSLVDINFDDYRGDDGRGHDPESPEPPEPPHGFKIPDEDFDTLLERTRDLDRELVGSNR